MVVLGLGFMVLAWFLRKGMPDAHTAITNVSSTFMFVAGIICIVGGLVVYFLRNEEEEPW